jgi:hypothetical protein
LGYLLRILPLGIILSWLVTAWRWTVFFNMYRQDQLRTGAAVTVGLFSPVALFANDLTPRCAVQRRKVLRAGAVFLGLVAAMVVMVVNIRWR